MFTPAELVTLLVLVRKVNPDVISMSADEVAVELKLSQLVKDASEPHNPHESFGGGMNAATDAEAAESIK